MNPCEGGEVERVRSTSSAGRCDGGEGGYEVDGEECVARRDGAVHSGEEDEVWLQLVRTVGLAFMFVARRGMQGGWITRLGEL